MLTTKQTVLRRFWYAVMPLADLADGPKPFRLMGEDIVLFLDEDGKPAALKDRCVHRTAKLSKGWCDKGQLVCGYHGWVYDRTGRVTKIPQFAEGRALGQMGTPAYLCEARYGYAWVCLDDAPLAPIYDIPEETDLAFRRIPQFYHVWETAPLRLMENSFDNAHFSFVHRATFGQQSLPKPEKYEITETPEGFVAETIVPIANPPAAHRITGSTEPTTRREMKNFWWMPFSRRMDMHYPSGIRHIILNCATPIEDGKIQLVQWLYRNDTEADCPADLLIEWDRRITDEDKDILEATDCDAPLDQSGGAEMNMPSDKPGLIMRRRLLDLLAAHGETEVRREA